MIGLWHDKLKHLEPQVASRAFDRWINERTAWPLPKTMLPLVEAEVAKAQKTLPGPLTPIDELNRALERAMSLLPSSMLVELHQLHDSNPAGGQRIINGIAEWAARNPDAGPARVAEFVAARMHEPVARAA